MPWGSQGIGGRDEIRVAGISFSLYEQILS